MKNNGGRPRKSEAGAKVIGLSIDIVNIKKMDFYAAKLAKGNRSQFLRVLIEVFEKSLLQGD